MLPHYLATCFTKSLTDGHAGSTQSSTVVSCLSQVTDSNARQSADGCSGLWRWKCISVYNAGRPPHLNTVAALPCVVCFPGH